MKRAILTSLLALATTGPDALRADDELPPMPFVSPAQVAPPAEIPPPVEAPPPPAPPIAPAPEGRRIVVPPAPPVPTTRAKPSLAQKARSTWSRARALVARPAAKKPRPVAVPESVKTVMSDSMATEERARLSFREKLQAEVADWLAADDVPRSWSPPGRAIEAMIAGPITVEAEAKDYALGSVMYKAAAPVEFSSARKAQFLQAYRRNLGMQRLGGLGAGLALVLACLAIVFGYVRADEATKGYYTNRLRLAAAAGLGAAGVAFVHMLRS